MSVTSAFSPYSFELLVTQMEEVSGEIRVLSCRVEMAEKEAETSRILPERSTSELVEGLNDRFGPILSQIDEVKNAAQRINDVLFRTQVLSHISRMNEGVVTLSYRIAKLPEAFALRSEICELSSQLQECPLGDLADLKDRVEKVIAKGVMIPPRLLLDLLTLRQGIERRVCQEARERLGLTFNVLTKKIKDTNEASKTELRRYITTLPQEIRGRIYDRVARISGVHSVAFGFGEMHVVDDLSRLQSVVTDVRRECLGESFGEGLSPDDCVEAVSPRSAKYSPLKRTVSASLPLLQRTSRRANYFEEEVSPQRVSSPSPQQSLPSIIDKPCILGNEAFYLYEMYRSCKDAEAFFHRKEEMEKEFDQLPKGLQTFICRKMTRAVKHIRPDLKVGRAKLFEDPLRFAKLVDETEELQVQIKPLQIEYLMSQLQLLMRNIDVMTNRCLASQEVHKLFALAIDEKFKQKVCLEIARQARKDDVRYGEEHLADNLRVLSEILMGQFEQSTREKNLDTAGIFFS